MQKLGVGLVGLVLVACTAEVAESGGESTSELSAWPAPSPMGPGPIVGAALSSTFPSIWYAQQTQLWQVYMHTVGSFQQGAVRVWSAPQGSTFNALSQKEERFSSPTGYVVFLSMSDGFLRAYDSTNLFADTRRKAGDGSLVCPFAPGDTLRAPAVMQRYADSTPRFKASIDGSGHVSEDLVVVPTWTGCGDTVSNQVLAYYAKIHAGPMTLKWAFNRDRRYKVAPSNTACALDPAADRVYCGTTVPTGSTTANLWALDSVTGRPVWAAFTNGSVSLSPRLANGRLYVATHNGSNSNAIQVFDSATGALRWSFQLPPSEGTASNGFVDAWMDPVLAPDFVIAVLNDSIRFIHDDGASAQEVLRWEPHGEKITSGFVFDPTLGRLWLGVTGTNGEGKIVQLAGVNGALIVDGQETVLSPGLVVTTPAVDHAPDGTTRIVTAASRPSPGNAVVQSFYAPLTPSAPGGG